MAKKANYQEFDTMPAWTRAVWGGKPGDGNVVNDADPFKWSGKSDPPAIGDKVKLYVNALGTGTVVKYFVEYGWFGLLVKLDDPPEWYVKQNKGNPLAHAFGIDLEPRTVKA